MTFLLDTNVLSDFFQARRHIELATAARTVPCAIADVVRDELAADSQRRKAFSAWLPTSNLDVVPILVGSAADRVQLSIEIGLTTPRGKGERAAIALAAADPSFTFVAMDKGALWIALRELWTPGERLIGLPVFLRRLVDAGALEGNAADDVMAGSRHVMPTWWAAWRAG